MKLKYWTLSIVALAAFSGAVPSANAQYSPSYYPGQNPAYYPTPNPGYYSNPNLVANPEVVRSAFASRYGEISAQINQAASTGQLTPAEANNFTSGLNQISSDLNSSSATGLTNDASNSMVARLTALAQQVTSQISANTNLMWPAQRASAIGGWNYRGGSLNGRARRAATRPYGNQWR